VQGGVGYGECAGGTAEKGMGRMLRVRGGHQECTGGPRHVGKMAKASEGCARGRSRTVKGLGRFHLA
jgi:hypothetical protein